MFRLNKTHILFRNNTRCFRLFTQQLKGVDILKEAYKYKTFTVQTSESVNCTDSCFEILQKMEKKKLKGINIVNENEDSQMVCYENVLDTCRFNEWIFEEDIKILNELMIEK